MGVRPRSTVTHFALPTAYPLLSMFKVNEKDEHVIVTITLWPADSDAADAVWGCCYGGYASLLSRF